jgi:hypothetical protein
VKLSSAPDKYSQTDQAQTRGALEREDARNLKRGVAQDAIYLIATDDKSTMKGTVDSAGVLTWTQVSRA